MSRAGLPGETWGAPGFIFTFPPGPQVVRLEAIGIQWSGWPTYGQCAFAEISVLNPVAVDEGTWGGVKSPFLHDEWTVIELADGGFRPIVLFSDLLCSKTAIISPSTVDIL